MAQILFSKSIEFADVYALNDLFRTDTGRRRFTQIMQASMKEIPTLVLSDNSFELILYLINTILQQIDLSDSKDLIGAKVLMRSACSLSRKEGNTHHFVKDYIKNYAVWKNITFWEEYFWDTLAKKHRKKFGEQIKDVDREITVQIISSFAYNMVSWGVTKDAAIKFARDMAYRNSIPASDMTRVEDYVQSHQVTEGRENSKETSVQHNFQEKYFSSPTYCFFCKQFIWGVASKQGYKCDGCGFKIHKRCLKGVQSTVPCHAILEEMH